MSHLASSIAPCVFHADPMTTYYVVGTGKDMLLNPRKNNGGFIHVYRLVQGGLLELLHKTEIEEVPYAILAFQGRLLVGVGNVVRIFDLGKKKLLRKCENKVKSEIDLAGLSHI
jgi:splicing factor 3B subunit 3